jgi:SWI/SNF-related matrix-associated actin-dependent regulator 1 of chromatin subfamily A
MNILENEAKNILINYNGENEQLLNWKSKFFKNKKYAITRTQAEYVIKYWNVKPKVAKKYVNILKSFAERIQNDLDLDFTPNKFWCEKLLCESDKAYHIFGKLNDNEVNHCFWIPKAAIAVEPKKLDREIDYSIYSHRPPMNHQKEAIERLLANNKFILADSMGVGKALENNTFIYTPTGKTKIKDLKVDDYVIGSNGNKCKVIGVYPQGKKDIYKINFNDGVSILCCKEHLWSVKINNTINKTLSLKEILKNHRYDKIEIPLVQPINFENNITFDEFVNDINNEKYIYSNIDVREKILAHIIENNIDINKENLHEIIYTLGGYIINNEILLPNDKKLERFILNIEYHSKSECTCISVDSEDKLYVAEYGIVTHNTTSAVIAALESKAKKILIVTPASLKINWKREIENYSDRKILIVENGKWGSTFDFYIINFDILKNYHSTEKNKDGTRNSLILDEKFDLVIIDESHQIANPTALRTKIINDIVDNIEKVWLLTGTPITSRPINFFNLLRIVKSPLATNWQNYVIRYCAGYQFKVNGKKIWNTSGASNLDELRDATKNIMIRRHKEDILDLPSKIISPVFLELKNTSYDDDIEEFVKITKENKNKESLSITINRLMGIRKLIAIEKVPITCEIADRIIEQDKKVIIFTNFTSSLELLHEYFGKKSVVLDGRMSNTKRQESVDKFQNDPKIKVFISNIKAGGVGITLTAAEVTIMNDLSFVPSDHAQAEDRCYRYGQKNNVIIYYPIFENTIEQIVYNMLNKKKNIIDQAMGDGEYSENFLSEFKDSILK